MTMNSHWTPEQIAIQNASDHYLIVEANAGVGKTTVLARRVAQAVENGCKPHLIAVLTYTHPGVKALQATLLKVGLASESIRQLRLTTFEDFSISMLHALEGVNVEQRTTPESVQALFWNAARQVQNTIRPAFRDELSLPSLGDDTAVETFLQTALHLKGTLQLPLDDEYPRDITPAYAEKLGRDFTFLKLFSAFEAQRWPARHADYPAFRGAHDATYDLAKWLMADETLDLCPRWPRGLQLVLVDEMHDLNAAMFAILLKLLQTNPQSYFCGAGDRHQVIHQLNGADMFYMQDALPQRLNKPMRYLPLTLSQRFGPILAKWAGQHAHKKYAGSPDKKTKVLVKTYDDENPCEPQIVQVAMDWRRDTKKLYRPEFVILLRHPHQSLAIENAFLKAEVPYTTLGFESYLLRPEVLWVRGLLALLLDKVTGIASSLSRERMLRAFVFFSGIELKDKDRPERTPLQVLNAACQDARENPQVLRWFFDHQVLPNSPEFVKKRLQAAMKTPAQDLLDAQKLDAWIDKLDMPLWANHVYVTRGGKEQLLHHIQALRRHALLFKGGLEWLQELKNLEERQQTNQDFGSERANKRVSRQILLATIDQVKGLEFDHVLIPYLEKNKFPSQTALIQDEHHLFYVGMTRARASLTVWGHAQRPSEWFQRYTL